MGHAAGGKGGDSQQSPMKHKSYSESQEDSSSYVGCAVEQNYDSMSGGGNEDQDEQQ